MLIQRVKVGIGLFLLFCGAFACSERVSTLPVERRCSDYVWEATCYRPLVDPPLDRQLSLEGCIGIQNRLDEELTRLQERGELSGVTTVYFVPISLVSARVVVVNNFPFEEENRAVLDKLGAKAQRMYAEELGMIFQ